MAGTDPEIRYSCQAVTQISVNTGNGNKIRSNSHADPIQIIGPLRLALKSPHIKMRACQGPTIRIIWSGSCHKRQKPQAPTPQAPIRNRQTRKVANAKGLNRNTNLT